MAKTLIISADEDFSASISEQIVQQLQVECAVVADLAAAEPLLSSSISIISDGKMPATSLPDSAIILPAAGAPYRLSQVLSQVKNALETPQQSREIGAFCHYAPRSKQLIAGDKSVELTDREAELLVALLDAGAGGLSKDALLRQVWGFEADINTHTLETHIYRLRGKIRELCDHELIEATQGGYRLI
ncbi:MAG: winged helix family transcriptional regulator [Alphaproteobacteria bacterium]|nr:winged helix family transcriptional regulator [Alphaproteobacteria bacterium]